MAPAAKPTAPGPRGGLILGSLREYKRDPLGFFLRSALEFPDIARFRMAHKQVFLVVSPEAIKHVTQDNARNYAKGISYDSLRSLLGQGLLVSEGELWRRQRKLLQPAFHRQTLETKTAVMKDSIEAALSRWRPGVAFDLVPEMMRLAFDIVGKTLMGSDISDAMQDVERVLADAVEYVYRRMEAPFKLPEAFPTRWNRRFRSCVQTLDGVVARVIAARRAESGNDLLSIMMRGEAMSDRQLRDEVLTFLLAGHETAGDALCWTLYLLAQHPEIERRASADEAYVAQVVDESMRLYPPAWSFTRTAVASDTMLGYRIPAGAIIIVSPYVNHRHPRFWPQPERFDPDRFDGSREIPPYAYFPFGVGPHACIGRHLALLEVRLATSLVLRKFRLRLIPGQAVVAEPRISLKPRRILVTAEPR